MPKSKIEWNGRIVVSNPDRLEQIGSLVQHCVGYYLENDGWKSCGMRIKNGRENIVWYDILKTGTMKVVAYLGRKEGSDEN